LLEKPLNKRMSAERLVLVDAESVHISEARGHLVRFELGTQTGTNWTERRQPGQYDAPKVRYWPIEDILALRGPNTYQSRRGNVFRHRIVIASSVSYVDST